MRVFVDAPLLVYLNTLDDPAARAPYERFYLNLLREHKLYIDVLVLDEILYVSKRKYGVPYKLTSEFIESLVLPYVRVLSLSEDEYRLAAGILIEHGIKPSDALHVGAMLNNGINVIVSEDREFDRIPGIRRLWL